MTRSLAFLFALSLASAGCAGDDDGSPAGDAGSPADDAAADADAHHAAGPPPGTGSPPDAGPSHGAPHLLGDLLLVRGPHGDSGARRLDAPWSRE